MTGENDPVVLVEVPTETQASIILAVLKDEGIDAYSTGGLTSGWRAEAPGMVKVYVRRSDLTKAEVVLEAAQESNEDTS